MDLNTVTSYRRATTRADLALAPGERFLAGGTWLFADPDPTIAGLVDLTTMDWPHWERTAAGLTIGATCPISEIARMPAEPGWAAHPLFEQCCHALLASWKVWSVATVGGNVGRSFAAAAMIHLLVALDATAVIWTPDGGERRCDIIELPTGNGTHALAAGEVMRAFEIPERALRGRTGFAKIALAQLGRSGAVLSGRLDEDGGYSVVVTAATDSANRLRYESIPDPDTLADDLAALPNYYTDALGTADWRKGVTIELSLRIREELAA